jgi:signal transduction histidine kinase
MTRPPDPGAAGRPRRPGWRAAAGSFFAPAEPPGPLPRPAVAVDLALALAAALASYLVLLITTHQQHVVPMLLPGHPVVLPPPGAGTVAGIPLPGVWTIIATTVALAARRRCPLTAFWIVGGCALLGHGYVSAVTVAVVVFAGYSAVVHSRYRRLALLGVPALGLVAAAALPNTTPPLPGRFTALLMLTVAAIIGNAIWEWRRRASDSQARMLRLQAEHEAATRRAIELEHIRIAGELHDVVTHNVSVMVVQAGAARKVLRASPGEATEALLAVEASGRAALAELRHLLGLLAPVGEPGGAAAEVSLAPAPGLDQLPPLIGRVSAAGLPVTLDVGGSPRGLPPGLDLAAYRVVQEGLTNVIRHGGAARTLVRLDYRPDELLIEVADEGAAGQGPAGQGPAGLPPAGLEPAGGHPGPGPGRGLLGLRERVALYGGTLDAGPRPGGGWRIAACLPLDPAAARVPVP